MQTFVLMFIFLLCRAWIAQAADCHDAPAIQLDGEESLLASVREYFRPMPPVTQWLAEKNITKAQIELGRRLFHDPRLSVNGRLSCASCHPLGRFGMDGQPQSPGWAFQRGVRNTPTVFNSSLYMAQFWDGRAEDVEQQAAGPLLNPLEMGLANEAAAENIIRRIDGYRPLFEAAFAADGQQDSITFANISRAIGAFERSLLTPTRFDAYINGERGALTKHEKDGLRTFMRTNCIMCHNGVGMGGSQFRLFGFEKGPYWHYTRSKKIDLGRFNVSAHPDTLYIVVPE